MIRQQRLTKIMAASAAINDQQGSAGGGYLNA
jgi:hypothetical protein